MVLLGRRSLALALTLLALAAGPGAVAQSPFAALSVVPKGRQVLDITTGVTLLPEGGYVVDQQTGVRLDAEHIRYLDGAFIEASQVSVSGNFGDLKAESLRIDIPEGQLSADGGLSLKRDELVLTAERMHYYAGDNVAEFDGSVASTSPAFAADRALLDTLSGDVLLIGRYRFEGGFLTLASPEEGGWLELRLRADADTVTYDASTDVGEDLIERFKSRL